VTNTILILAISAILIVGTIAPNQIAFADDDDRDKECKEDLEDFIKKTNKLIDKKKLLEEQGQSLIILVEVLIENDCGTVVEIDEVKALVESYDLKKNDSEKLIDELEDAKKEIENAIKKAKKNTLEYKCAKQLNKNHLSLHGLFCAAIFDLKDLIDDLLERVTLLEENGVGLPGPPGPPGPPRSGGTTDAPALSFTFSPQPTQTSGLDCNAGTAGTIYYQEIPDQQSQMCVCIDTTGNRNYAYQDLFSNDPC